MLRKFCKLTDKIQMRSEFSTCEQKSKSNHSVPRGGMIFVPSTRQNGAIAKLQEPGWGQIQGGDDFRQSSRGGLLYHDELLVFPQNASP